MEPAVKDMVYSFRDIEEEPYTICRWLRATKMDASKILKRLEENVGMWKEASKHDFYPDPSKELGCPFSLFLTQYPFLGLGRGKNGCPVNYFQVGKIHPEGIMCLTTAKQTEAYFWHSFMYLFKKEIKRAQAENPDFVRCEGINIIDLQGLSASAITSETMDVIKIASKISDFFPETLHCMLVLNAPSFFSFSWSVIKKFIDPRTASRIQVFSSTEKGLKALFDLVDKKQIPIDYGGSNKSVASALLEQSADPSITRQSVHLVHVKKHKAGTCEFKLNAGESVTIKVYTRSAGGSDFCVRKNQQLVRNAKVVQADVSGDSPVPKCTRLVKVEGPGTIHVEATDRGDKTSKHHSSGYFLVVGDVG